MMQEQDEQIWIQRCLEGTPSAFSYLVARHQDAVVNLARRITGSRADGEDVAQEAFLRAYRKLHQYKPNREFRSWLLGITANLAKNHNRSRSRRQDREQVEPLLRTETTATDPRLEVLSLALDQLSPSDRAMLTLKYMEGYAVSEIAEILGLGQSAVKMRLSRAREQLLAHPLLQKE